MNWNRREEKESGDTRGFVRRYETAPSAAVSQVRRYKTAPSAAVSQCDGVDLIAPDELLSHTGTDDLHEKKTF